MIRFIAAFATATALLTAAPAQAAPTPLSKQTSVRFTERTYLVNGSAKTVFMRRSGAFLLSPKGIRASDVTGKLAIRAADLVDDRLTWMLHPERTIRIGTTSYISGGFHSRLLPVDRLWLKIPKGPAAGVTGMYGQLVNIAEPQTRTALLKTAKPTSYGYRGTITLGKLYQASPWLRASLTAKPAKPGVVIAWRLVLNRHKLPVRLVSTYSTKEGDVLMDTRFTGWNATVKIAAPPADQVWDGTEQQLPETPAIVSPAG